MSPFEINFQGNPWAYSFGVLEFSNFDILILIQILYIAHTYTLISHRDILVAPGVFP